MKRKKLATLFKFDNLNNFIYSYIISLNNEQSLIITLWGLMSFEIVGDITNVETIVIGNSIREIKRLRKVYGPWRWRKLKGITMVRFSDGTICKAEIHWY